MDKRYVDSSDPTAVLRAWGGASESDATMDMGGWTDEDVTAFREAVQEESVRGAGEPLACIVIEPVDH